ncbi:MAG: T9SS type A sorting domain-containing protein [Bacteroidia bacterium]|nr:T9SS type A sorting domain-containing protein [Bacteroidia bacterium]
MPLKRIYISVVIICALMCPLFFFAQSDYEKQEMLSEKSSDPYLPNAFNRKKVSPGYNYQSAHKLSGTASTITTVQVNVDSLGQNILSDAANEPSIAISPVNSNSIVIGWRQFDNVGSSFRQAGWAYTTNGGQNWTFPGVIEPGIFRSDPVLGADAAGNFYYNSLTNFPTYMCKTFKSTDGGVSWDIGTDAMGGDKQWMVIDRSGGVGSGNIYSAWNENYSSCTPYFFTRSTDGNLSYETCTTVDGNPYWATMAVDDGGELFIGGGGSGGIVVCKSLDAQTAGSTITWELPVTVTMDGNVSAYPTVNPAGLLGQVSIDVDKPTGPTQGNVYLLASLFPSFVLDPGDIMFASSTDGGLTWNSPVKVNDDIDPSGSNTQWLGTMSVAPNGRIDAAWLDTRDDIVSFDSSALYYSYSADFGLTWSANEKLSANFDPHVGYPNQDKMGDYFHMISDNTGAHLAWAGTLNGEQDVYYSHIVPPPIAIGINENKAAQFSFFPNPNTGKISLISASEKSRLEIYSALGEKVYAMQLLKSKNEIDISALANGIYFLKLILENGTISVKKLISPSLKSHFSGIKF